MRASVMAVQQHTIRPLRVADLDGTARLHQRVLPMGFLPRVGTAALRAYHETFVSGPHGVALLAEVDGRPAGMVVGTAAQRAHVEWVRRHRVVSVGAAVLVGVARRPRLWPVFATTRVPRYLRALLSSRRRWRAPTARAPRHDVAVLAHLAVEPSSRGAGVGGALVDAFERAAVSSGAAEAVLVTGADPAGGAGPFYAARGWCQAAVRLDQDGVEVVEYRKELH